MSDNGDEDYEENDAESQENSPLLDVKKKLFDELDNVNLGELTELEVKKLSDLLSPYLKNNDSTSPAKKASDEGTILQEPGMTVKKDNYMHGGLMNARRIKEIQRSIFTPTKSLRYMSTVTEPIPSSIANFSQSKVLKINNSYNIDTEVMRSKRKLIDNGPPTLPNDSTFSAFSDWKSEILEFLQLLPGYQVGMLTIPPNLEKLEDEEMNSIRDKYELIYQTLVNSTNKNKLVKLKTSNIPRLPIRDLVSWWAIVEDLFQPSDVQIKILLDDFSACTQKTNKPVQHTSEKLKQKLTN